MVAFFVPGAEESGSDPEELWLAVSKFAHENLQWTIADTRIYALDWIHEGVGYRATIGEECPRIGGVVVAILESNAYLVCTPNRGVLRGEPMLVGTGEALDVELFDSPASG